MREITGRLIQAGEFEIIIFGDKVRLQIVNNLIC